MPFSWRIRGGCKSSEENTAKGAEIEWFAKRRFAEALLL